MNMNDEDPQAQVTGKVLAWLAYAALGVAALLNTILAVMALVGGHLAGALGEVATQIGSGSDAAQVATDAGHAALVAKLIAVLFGVLAATEYAAGHFIRARVRTVFVPIAMALTFVGELGFSLWAKQFTAIDAIVLACAAFASWVWWKLPRRTPAVTL
jgi:hypothetical protein